MRTVPGKLGWGAAGAALLALAYAAYVELGGPVQQAPARARGCLVCHTGQELLPGLRSRRPGDPLRPWLHEQLVQAHPLLSRGAEEELVEHLLAQQLPLLAEQRAGAPGQVLYAAKCAACHGRDGAGTPGQYPPLQGSAWLTDEPSRLQEILTQGLSGRIEVRGEVWDKTMRAPGLSTPEEVEQVIRFLRAEFAPQ